jgi:Ca-activated chloride channel family protein
MGFSSGVNENSFTRKPLNLSVVVDRSGSMSGDKLGGVKSALNKLLAQLTEKDRLSIVLFDDQVDVLLPSTPVTNKAGITALVSSIHERGSTNLSAGLAEGFAQVEQYASVEGVSDRVIVLTDAIANTGSVDTETFISQANAAAEKGIGLTVFGVGIDLNQELVLAISRLRGGNYAYLADYERIATVFDEDFDYLVTPLAYDLKLTLSPATGFGVKTVYGWRSDSSTSSSVEIDIATVFLSRAHGAVVARLEPTGEWPSGSTPLAHLTLNYVSASDTEKTNDVFETLYDETNPLGNNTLFYSQIGVRRTIAYVNAALGMKQACALYWDGNRTDAIALLDKTNTLLTDEAAATEDDNLNVEASRMTQLRYNMRNRSDYDDNDEGLYLDACNLCHSSDTSSRSLLFLLGAVLFGRRTRRRFTE